MLTLILNFAKYQPYNNRNVTFWGTSPKTSNQNPKFEPSVHFCGDDDEKDKEKNPSCHCKYSRKKPRWWFLVQKVFKVSEFNWNEGKKQELQFVGTPHHHWGSFSHQATHTGREWVLRFRLEFYVFTKYLCRWICMASEILKCQSVFL